MTEKATILCVEDESLLLEDLRDELIEEGYRVLTAGDGKAALEVLSTDRPDLILCDMMMPRMDGPSLLKEIRDNHKKLDNVPFIFLTAKATRDDIIMGKRLGVDDYLTKPVDYDLLLATVDASIGQIKRIEEQNNKKLRMLYKALQDKRHKGPATKKPRPLTISIITAKPNLIQPLTTAMRELGCEVSFISEDQLAKRSFDLQNVDLLFMMYSKVVHYYLKYVTEERPQDWDGETIILAPPKITVEQRNIITDSGVDDFIEYPYPPVDIFKLILKKVKGAPAMASGTTH
ncbi:response regulator transcription factor [Labrenzia sp. PHM005]|uniref:response regulator transcription factor n=1 Tax=Labrenzia sp. PHM005 TaxID=2590016 RepID=UPI0011407EEB|nr:response regulator [Labrenzia sp. PHM005]QDG78472.1 response regulator [Labrenzia sp. PHM005]